MVTEALEEMPPITPSGQILGEVRVLGERMGGFKESFDEFRGETRRNFERADSQVAELKREFRDEVGRLRQEVSAEISGLDVRLRTQEDRQKSTDGGVAVAKWLWGAVAALGAALLIGITQYLSTGG